MPVTANTALLAAAGALALTLYDRGVWQSAWAALHGGDVPLRFTTPDAGIVSPGGGAGTGSYGPPPPGGDVAAAENAVIAEGPPGGGGDWLNWCLNLVNRTYAKLGHPLAALGAPDARQACDRLTLHPGIAPAGSIVCFSDAPGSGLTQGHVGIANANNTYSSVGITHGGITIRDYLGNPQYRGWSTG